MGFDKADGIAANLSPADFADFERDNTTMTSMGANGFVGLATISDGRGEAERAGSVQVTSGFFSTLHVQPALGRLISPDDDRPGAARVVVLSHGFWQRRFGGDPSMVGRSISLNARPATVIGILPEDFRHLEINPERPADLFSPFRFDPAQPNRGAHFIRAVGRLKDGVTVDEARAEIETIAARLEQQYPNENTDQGVRLNPLLDSMVSESRPVLLLLSAAVIVVLLVACANVANLLLARGTGRLREFALRAAIGADRGRLVRQMLTESVALSILGAAGGLLLAFWATRVLTGLAATGIPRADQIGLDVTVAGVRGCCRDVDQRGVWPAARAAPVEARFQRRAEGRRPLAGRRARPRGARALDRCGGRDVDRAADRRRPVDPQPVAASAGRPGVLRRQGAGDGSVAADGEVQEGEQMPFYQRLEERIAA